MKCPECGAEVGPGEKFCGNCGAPIEGGTAEAVPGDETILAGPSMMPPEPPPAEEPAYVPPPPPPPEEPAYIPPPPPPPPPPSPSPTSPGGLKSNKTIWIIVAIIVAVLLLCCCCAIIVAVVISANPDMMSVVPGLLPPLL